MTTAKKLIKEAEQFRDAQKAGAIAARKIFEKWIVLASKDPEEARTSRDAMIDQMMISYRDSLKAVVKKAV